MAAEEVHRESRTRHSARSKVSGQAMAATSAHVIFIVFLICTSMVLAYGKKKDSGDDTESSKKEPLKKDEEEIIQNATGLRFLLCSHSKKDEIRKDMAKCFKIQPRQMNNTIWQCARKIISKGKGDYVKLIAEMCDNKEIELKIGKCSKPLIAKVMKDLNEDDRSKFKKYHACLADVVKKYSEDDKPGKKTKTKKIMKEKVKEKSDTKEQTMKKSNKTEKDIDRTEETDEEKSER